MLAVAYQLFLKGGVSELSRDHPDLEWHARPLGRYWMLTSSGPAEELGRVARQLGRGRVVKGDDGSSGAWSGLSAASASERELLEFVDEEGAVPLPPLRWKAGALTLRILTPGTGLPRRFSKVYPQARLLLKRSVTEEALPAELSSGMDILPSFSPRQREVLQRAIASGYYEVPRRANVRTIARSLGIARSTAEEHLRSAESSLVRAVAPLVEVGASESAGRIPSPRAAELYARFSSRLGLFVAVALEEGEIAGVSLRRIRPAGARRNHPYLARILHHLATGEEDLRDLPVRLRVSPFERRVLDEIRRIPSGATLTYGELARRLGCPSAARAVGNACAHNPVPLVVPCHRVVPSSGRVGNYSGEGGSRTKRLLLDVEHARPAGSARRAK
jgi:methylated-DNA-[protein]-cysteine S-methyltransferase